MPSAFNSELSPSIATSSFSSITRSTHTINEDTSTLLYNTPCEQSIHFDPVTTLLTCVGKSHAGVAGDERTQRSRSSTFRIRSLFPSSSLQQHPNPGFEAELIESYTFQGDITSCTRLSTTQGSLLAQTLLGSSGMAGEFRLNKDNGNIQYRYIWNKGTCWSSSLRSDRDYKQQPTDLSLVIGGTRYNIFINSFISFLKKHPKDSFDCLI